MIRQDAYNSLRMTYLVSTLLEILDRKALVGEIVNELVSTLLEILDSSRGVAADSLGLGLGVEVSTLLEILVITTPPSSRTP